MIWSVVVCAGWISVVLRFDTVCSSRFLQQLNGWLLSLDLVDRLRAWGRSAGTCATADLSRLRRCPWGCSNCATLRRYRRASPRHVVCVSARRV